MQLSITFFLHGDVDFFFSYMGMNNR